MKTASAVLLSTLLLISLSNCSGWYLRGTQSNEAITASIALTGSSGAVFQQVSNQLKKQQQLAHPVEADAVVILEAEQWQNRRASVSSNGNTAEYELTLRLPYTLSQKSGDNSAQQIQIIRSYQYDSADIVGKEKEEAIIRRDMQQDASRQLLRRLSLL